MWGRARQTARLCSAASTPPHPMPSCRRPGRSHRRERLTLRQQFGLMWSSTSGRASVHPDRLHLGLSCRWLDGTVRQQCVGHLPFARRATVNGGFSVRRTGSIDPQRPVESSEVQRQLPDRCGRLQLLYTDTGRRMLWIATAGATNGNPASTMWNSTRRRERSISSSAGKCRPIPSGLSGR